MWCFGAFNKHDDNVTKLDVSRVISKKAHTTNLLEFPIQLVQSLVRTDKVKLQQIPIQNQGINLVYSRKVKNYSTALNEQYLCMPTTKSSFNYWQDYFGVFAMSANPQEINIVQLNNFAPPEKQY